MRAHSETKVSGWSWPSPLPGEWHSFNYYLYTMEQSALLTWMWSPVTWTKDHLLCIEGIKKNRWIRFKYKHFFSNEFTRKYRLRTGGHFVASWIYQLTCSLFGVFKADNLHWIRINRSLRGISYRYYHLNSGLCSAQSYDKLMLNT